MTLSEDTAALLARTAGRMPFEQSRAMDTSRFVSFLRDRAVRFEPWALVHLAIHGVLRPLAWGPADFVEARPERFFAVGTELETYGDRGPLPPIQAVPPVPAGFTRPDATWPGLWWHPFQLWLARRAYNRVRLPMGPSQPLHGAEVTGRFAAELTERLPQQLADFGNASETNEFYQVLALLVSVEPLVIGRITGSRSYQPFFDETPEAFAKWTEEFNHAQLLATTGMTVERLRHWHRELSIEAQLVDPIARWRELLRYAPRRKREEFRGEALLAEDLYYAAEVIRRYLELFHDVRDLPDEDGVAGGPQVQQVKKNLYGSETTTGSDRSVFRNVVRQFGLDPQPRMRWFVEGDTEEGFVERYFDLLQVDIAAAGIEVINLGGGDIESRRNSQLLKISRDEEVFTQVTVDHDGRNDRARVLKNLEKKGLLLADSYEVFVPDFVSTNFTAAEVADAVWRHASERGLGERPTEQLIAGLLEVGGAAVEDLLGRWVRQRGGSFPKGKAWGAALAEALLHSSETHVRPVDRFLSRAVRANQSNYRSSVRRQVEDRL
ncbi:MAG: hypothetical protein AB7J35_18300 [Dehalococcoidia bacterium]